jgi:hypothetical protein
MKQLVCEKGIIGPCIERGSWGYRESFRKEEGGGGLKWSAKHHCLY